MSMIKYEIEDCVPLAVANAELQKPIEWKMLFEKERLENLEQFCWAHNTELEYVLVPFFAMSSAVAGKLTKIQSGLLSQGRTNIYLLMAGNPASGKSCGFELAVNKPKAAIEQELGISLITSDLSKPTLLKRLQQQTEEDHAYLIIASDEMGLYLKGECKDTKDWEVKRSVYNNSFSGNDIDTEKMIGAKKINTIIIRNPHLSIIGMTQCKPLFEWIRNVSSNDDGLLDRYLIWVVTESSQTAVIPDHIELPLDWPTQCLLAVTKYHLSKPSKEYIISPSLYKKICELEWKNTQLYKQQRFEYRQLVGQGKEEEAVLYNRNNPEIRVARFSELTIRFAVGIHVGLFAMNQILGGFDLGNIPKDISETTIDFSIAAVQRCINQVRDFRMVATKVSSKQMIGSFQVNDDAKQINTKQDSYQLRQITPKMEPEITESVPSRFVHGLNKTLLKKIVTFPAAFYVPASIYNFTKDCTAKEVHETLSYVSNQHAKCFLGKTLKIKPNIYAKRSYHVFFRAPYSKVDKNLLNEFGIEDEKDYQLLLTGQVGHSNCRVRKVIETKATKWKEFAHECMINRPSFDD